MQCPDCGGLRHEGECKTVAITCRKCGDEVQMPPGRSWCWQCIEESEPVGCEE